MKTLLSLAFVFLIHFLGGIDDENARSSYFNMISHHRLTGHLIKTTTADTELMCAHKCLLNETCKSCNFKTIPQKDGICELNTRASLSQTHDPALIHDENFVFIFLEDAVGCPRRFERKSCAEWYEEGQRLSGVYHIDPDGQGSFPVFCDQTSAGGGWTVFQKRLDGSVDFYRGWDDYKKGFGNKKGEYWLGLDKIHRLTNAQHNKLRVELEDWNGNTAYAEYSNFTVGNENSKYTLESLGSYSGTAGDSMSHHTGMKFTTNDRNNGKDSPGNCAIMYKGAWWYYGCHQSNLNGLYHQGGVHASYADGINWNLWKGHYYSANRAEMKVRPVDFVQQ